MFPDLLARTSSVSVRVEEGTSTMGSRRTGGSRASWSRACIAGVIVGGVALVGGGAASAVTPVKDAVISGSNDAFLRTNFVEVGARPNGSFGSNNAAPDGTWHPNVSNKIGFRADRTKDGWGVRTDDGDFFLPGGPLEGFTLNVDGVQKANSNNYSEVSGSFSTTSVSGNPTVVWQSSADTNGVSLKQTYSLPTDGSLYIDIATEVTNNNGSSSNVYVARWVDPDNCILRGTAVCDSNGDGTADRVGSGVYETQQKVESQILDGGASSMVSASQTDGSKIALATADAESVALADGAAYVCDYALVDIATAYNLARTYTAASRWEDTSAYGACGINGYWFNKTGETRFGDNLIMVVAHRTIAAGATTTFNFRYLLSAAELLKFGQAAGTETTVTAASPSAVSSGAEVPEIAYSSSPATTAGDWINEPLCAVYAPEDTTYSTPLTGVLPVGSYVTHCAGGDSIGYLPTTYGDGTFVVRAATLPPTGSNTQGLLFVAMGLGALGVGALTVRRRFGRRAVS